MNISITKPLFAWDCLEDSPTLQTLRSALAAMPDGRLLNSLHVARGRGRKDYPVHVLWGTVVLTVMLRHPTFEACLEELRRNPSPRQLIGIRQEKGVPKKWNISRFLDVLGRGPFRTMLRALFDEMVRGVGAARVALGRHTAGDSTGLSARRKGEAGARAKETKEGLPQPSGGRKEYVNEKGKVERVLAWFGYKLHLLVDVNHEVALAYQVTAPATGDNEMLSALVKEAQANLPPKRMESLAYDKAADDEAAHQVLEQAGIRPVIEDRHLWKEESERMLPGHDGSSNVVYDESGTVYCYDKVSAPPVRQRMAYIGHEAQRGTLKYRCPARQEGWQCPSDGRCNAGKTYGLTQRVKCGIDLRRFPPIPRATKEFERRYKGRTAVERVNARLKIFWGVDDGNIVGARRFHAFVGVVMLVHATFATLLAGTARNKGTLGTLHLEPLRRALSAGYGFR